jgi:rhodanese-related sulfurtransferase
MIKKIASILLILLTLTACSKPPYTEVDNNHLKTLISKGVPLYDIRRPDEWKQTGVIKESRLLTFIDEKGKLAENFLPTFSKTIAKNSPVAIICRTGNRSGVLARHLMEKMGYTTVYNVTDGMVSWLKEKNSVVRPGPTVF